ncbi:MAG: dienelactone hydrolase family protein [Bacteroidota bacterium]
MSIKLINNLLLKTKQNNRSFSFDIRYLSSEEAKPVIIFVHGLKGFKDWGHFNLIGDYFAKAGFVFIKLNLSHNGTTPEHPEDLADLKAFGNNTLSKELEDIEVLVDYLFAQPDELKEAKIDLSNLFIIGHSRGGGLTIIKAYEDERIKGVITWSAVDDYGARWPKEDRDEWKKSGVRYMYNSRTKQNMPQYYSLVDDYEKNFERLNIHRVVGKLQVPALFIHGSNDETVDVSSARRLEEVSSTGRACIIEGASHTFGGRHPYPGFELPEHSIELADISINWLNGQINND